MKLSGYTTIRNAKTMNYPYIESIRSMLSFCDEVVVLDTSNDEVTSNELAELEEKEPKLIIVQAEIPWDAPNHGVYDGETKALARENCTGDLLWQMDADEVVKEADGKRIREVAKRFFETKTEPNAPKVLILPVIEFWGPNKIRADINPWKPRLSFNHPNLTHGIPASLMKIEDGLLYAKHGTDGCDYIDENRNPVQMRSVYLAETEQARRDFLRCPNKDTESLLVRHYAHLMSEFPGVYHYSWYSIPEKILKYKYFWNNSWKSLYNENRDPNWNPFTDQSLNDMSDRDIINLGIELEEKTGGWIFHQKWNGSNTPSLRLSEAEKFNISHPVIMDDWRKSVDLKKESE